MNSNEQRLPVEGQNGPTLEVVVWKWQCLIESVLEMVFQRQASTGIQVEVPCFAHVMRCVGHNRDLMD